MTRLALAEERAERALFMARHPVDLCKCGGPFMFCLYDQPACPRKPEPFAQVIDQLIDRGRVYP